MYLVHISFLISTQINKMAFLVGLMRPLISIPHFPQIRGFMTTNKNPTPKMGSRNMSKGPPLYIQMSPSLAPTALSTSPTTLHI